MAWIELLAAFAVFFVSHSLPLRPPVKSWLVGRVGPRAFSIGYSCLSLAVLAWLIAAAGRAPPVALWAWSPWQSAVPLVAMAVACAILAFGLARPNPLSFGGAGDEAFDPTRPGIVRWTRHPLLLALALWAAAHLVPNGDLAHVILFGLFAGFALLGMRIVDRRKRRMMGEPAWQALVQAVQQGSAIPRPLSWSATLVRLGLALLLYTGLLAVHGWLFGVSPLAW